MARSHAESLCSKLIEWAPEDLSETKIKENVCRELEAMCSVEVVICLRQVGL